METKKQGKLAGEEADRNLKVCLLLFLFKELSRRGPSPVQGHTLYRLAQQRMHDDGFSGETHFSRLISELREANLIRVLKATTLDPLVQFYTLSEFLMIFLAMIGKLKARNAGGAEA